MLTSIRKSDNIKVRARFSNKEDQPFLCPECGGETILKKGLIKIPHFAHKPPFDCIYGTGEKEVHRKAKEDICEELNKSKMVSFCEIEYGLGGVRPDVYFEINNHKIAIEIQISNITLEEIMNRTLKYANHGVYVLWLPVFTDELKNEKYRPKSWEKWLHTLYFGKIYYWREKLIVTPVKFSAFELYIEQTTWYENGEERTAGGYYRNSKQFRTPSIFSNKNLLNNFQPIDREPWENEYVSIPKSKIYILKNS